MIWFLENLDRLNKERTEIEKLFENCDWLIEADWDFYNGEICVNADICVDKKMYPVRLIYPSSFPACPLSVFPRNQEERWSTHQYGKKGELCLEYGPDNWMPDITGAQMIKSAYRLISLESENTQSSADIMIPSRHMTTLGQKLRLSVFRFLYDNDSVKFISNLVDDYSGFINLIEIFHKDDISVFIDNISVNEDKTWKNDSLPTGVIAKGYKNKGIFFKTDFLSNEVKNYNFTELKKGLISKGFDISVIEKKVDDKPEVSFILIFDKSELLHLFWIPKKSSDKLYRCDHIQIETLDHGNRLSTDFKILKDKRVGIIGLGSAGSKIAISLARSGVKNFLLIDDDILMPENICRNELDWTQIGAHKVDAVSEQLSLISCDMDIKVRRIKLSGQEASLSISSALDQLRNCDIIVDATADSMTFNQLSMFSKQYEKTYVWLEIFAGGIGGFLARFRPGYEPEPYVMRKIFHQTINEMGAHVLKSMDNYGAENEDGNIIVACDADVGVITNYAISMVIDLLIERKPSIFPHSMYLIGLNKGWIFEQPFHTYPIKIDNAIIEEAKENLCEANINENIEFISNLLEKKT